MYKSLFFIVIALSRLVAANENLSLNESLIYQQIMENESDVILFSAEEKVYLNPEKIHVTNRGIFVGATPLPVLHSDASGCWLQRPMSYWICHNPDCTNYRVVFCSRSNKCPVCHLAADPC